MPIRHSPVVLLSMLFLYGTGSSAAKEPLWFDEIFTYTVARFDSPLAIVRALLEKVDVHPPLDYLVRHIFITWLGGSEFVFRLPSLIAVWAAALCLYVFVLRRSSVVPALVAFSFLLSTTALRYAYEGRSYAFLLASMCLALLAWQFATEKASKIRLCLLIISLCIGPFSHYYGVLNYAPIVAGEAWRSYERQKISWPIVFAVLLSLVLLVLLVPFVINASENAGTFWTKFGPSTPFRLYGRLMGQPFHL